MEKLSDMFYMMIISLKKKKISFIFRFTRMMNWNMCLICQEKTTELLKCPLNAQRSGDKSEPYNSSLNNFNSFRALGTLSVVHNFREDMTVGELIQNWGAWHKSCSVKFSKEKLERATKKRDKDAARWARTSS